MQAVFAAIDRANRPFDADPATALRRSELKQRHYDLEQRAEVLSREIESHKTAEVRQLEQQLQQLQSRKSDSPSNGYHSQFASAADTLKWVQLDLGKVVSVDRVMLIPAFPTDWPDTPGFGFPVRFRVELSPDPLPSPSDSQTEAKSEVHTIFDHSQADFVNPAHQPVELQADGSEARFVRLTATRLWDRGEQHFALALGEVVVESEGENLAPGAVVSASDSIDSGRWHTKFLVDRHDSRKPLSQALGGKGQRDDKRIAEVERQLEQLLKKVAGESILRKRRETAAALKQVEQDMRSLPQPQQVYAGTVHRGGGAFRGRYGLGPREIRVLQRGEVTRPGRIVEPDIPAVFAQHTRPFDLPAGHAESERRLALANWITHADHPLTWRSIVNRVWQYHFGRGIVDSSNDFGQGGQLPSHPLLLDWLAVEFRDGGQSLKALHRLIVTSAVYRQASAHRTAAVAVDADNALLWRMNRRRLTAEEIRDAVLSVAGRLNNKMGGPGFMDFVIEKPDHSPHYEYDKYDPEDSATHRRSVYRFIVRSQPQPFMTALDCADPSMSVAKRDETLTPLQALTLMNNRFMVTMAGHFAKRIQREHTEAAQQSRRAFQLALAREPSADEQRAMLQYARQFGLKNMCRMLLNLNEFVFVD